MNPAHMGVSSRTATTSQARLRPPRCSEPGSRCCAEATPSPTPTAPASTSCSTPTRGCEPAGRPSRSSTASTPPTTMTAPWKPSGGSTDLYETGELPEYHDTVVTFIAWSDEILNWHCTRPPQQRQNRGHQPRRTLPTTPRREPELTNIGASTCSKCCAEAPTGSPNQRNFEARGILVTY